VVQTWASEMQDGGRPPSWKNRTSAHCSVVAEMGDRFATIDMGRGLQMQACLRRCNNHTMVSYETYGSYVSYETWHEGRPTLR